MHALMTPQIGHLYEFLIAVFAYVRLFARVQTDMGFQVMVSGKSLSAVLLRTLERFLAGMGAHVVLQHVLVPERVAAVVASIEPRFGAFITFGGRLLRLITR